MSSTSLENCIRYSGRKEKELSMCFNFHHLKVDYKDGDKWTLMEPDRIALKKTVRDMAGMHFSGAITISRELCPEWAMRTFTGKNPPRCWQRRFT